MNRIVKVYIAIYGETELDVSKVIAVVPYKRMLLFENVRWYLNNDDFNNVYKLWTEINSK